MRDTPSRSLRFAMVTKLGSVVASLVVVASIVAPTATAQDENAYDAWRRLFDVISPNWDDPEGARSPGFFTDDEYDAIFEWQDGPLEAPRGAARRYFEKAESIAPRSFEICGVPRDSTRESISAMDSWSCSRISSRCGRSPESARTSPDAPPSRATWTPRSSGSVPRTKSRPMPARMAPPSDRSSARRCTSDPTRRWNSRSRTA